MKRTLLAVFILFGLLYGEYANGQTDKFPSKPIKLMIASGPGSSTDMVNRVLAKSAEKLLGQPIMCLNTPGAGGTRALATVLGEKPDGYTLVTISASALVEMQTQKLGFDVSRDFTPVVQTHLFLLPFAVRKDAPWNTWQDFIKSAKGGKDIITIGSWGGRSFAWLLTTQIEKKEKVKFVYVPFAGPGEVMAALLGGHITANTLSSAMIHVKSGECKLLLVFSNERIASAPQVPTTKELYGLELVVFGGILAPKGLAKPVVQRLNEAFVKATEDLAFKEIIDKFDLLRSPKSSDEFGRLIKDTDDLVKDVLAKTN